MELAAKSFGRAPPTDQQSNAGNLSRRYAGVDVVYA
jgi:hypothetical protein